MRHEVELRDAYEAALSRLAIQQEALVLAEARILALTRKIEGGSHGEVSDTEGSVVPKK